MTKWLEWVKNNKYINKYRNTDMNKYSWAISYIYICDAHLKSAIYIFKLGFLF